MKPMFVSRYLLASILVVSISTSSFPQSTDDTPNRQANAEAALKEYEAMLKRAEAEGKIAENVRNQLSYLSNTPSVSGEAIETELIAMETLQCLSHKVWRSLPTGDVENLVVFEDTEAKLLADLRFMNDRAIFLSSNYQPIINRLDVDSVIAALIKKDKDTNSLQPEKAVITPSFVGGATIASSILGVFKEDVSVQGRMLVLNRDTFLTSFARHRPTVASSGGTANYSTIRLVLPSRIASGNGQDSELLKRVRTLAILKDRAQTLKPFYDQEANLKQNEVLAEQIKKETDPKKKEELMLKFNENDAKITVVRRTYPPNITDADIRKEVSKLRWLDAASDALLVKLGLRVPDDPKFAPTYTLTDILRVEKLATILDRPKTYWFDVGTTKLGGSTRTRKGIIPSIFNKDGQIAFSGGSAVSFGIYDSDGEMKWSGTETIYRPFRKSGKGIEYSCK